MILCLIFVYYPIVYVVVCVVYLDFVFLLRLRRPPRSTRTATLFPYTTLFRSLRVIADLERQTAGRIAVNGVTPEAARLQRAYGYVFQAPALYPWRDRQSTRLNSSH